VLFPVAHAEPAEFMFAHVASHVVTSLVFLDRPLALGTVLCVCNHPGNIFALALIFHQPFQRSVTVAGTMRVLVAFETEKDASLSPHLRDCVWNVFYAELASWVRAPLHVISYRRCM